MDINLSEAKKSYQQIIKTTSLFGSVQLFSILVSIIRNMFIANFIGPIGMGIAALLNSTLNIISGFSGLGLEMSGVKHISESYDENNSNSVSKQVAVVRRIALITGIIGAIIAMIFSKWLSVLTFGNGDYTFSFILIAITLLFKQLTSAENVVLQGLRKLKDLAKASFYGNLLGLLFSIPIYYFYKIDSIVPTIIITSFFSMVLAFVFARKNKFERIKIINNELVTDGKSIIKLGLALTFSGLITLIVAHLIQLYLNFESGIEVVGFYNAGFTLLNSYVGILFVAMSTDYYPRLSAISKDNFKSNEVVLQQIYIGLLIMTPIIILFFALSDEIVSILFSSKFNAIVMMVSVGIFGMFFKVVSFSIGYMVLAKADSKLFIKTSIGFNLLYLIISIIGYHYFNLLGLGIAFMVQYIFHLIILSIIVNKRYNFKFSNEVVILFVICLVLCIATFLVQFLDDGIIKIVLFIFLILFSCLFSLKSIDDKIDIKAFLQQKIK